MSATSPPPNQPGPPSEAAPLSVREQRVLASLAAAEFAADARFVNDLSAGRVSRRREPCGRAARWTAVVGAVVALGVMMGLAAGPGFSLAAVLVLVLVVPFGLTVWLYRQERAAG